MKDISFFIVLGLKSDIADPLAPVALSEEGGGEVVEEVSEFLCLVCLFLLCYNKEDQAGDSQLVPCPEVQSPDAVHDHKNDTHGYHNIFLLVPFDISAY